MFLILSFILSFSKFIQAFETNLWEITKDNTNALPYTILKSDLPLETNSDQFTIITWFYADDYPTEATILDKGSYSVIFNYKRTYQAACKTNSGIVSSTFKLSKQRWHQVVCTFDGSSLNIYVNGEKAAKTIQTTMSSSDNDLIIGNNFVGKIDKIEIIDSVMSYEKIYRDYDSYKDQTEGRATSFSLTKFFGNKKQTLYDPDVGTGGNTDSGATVSFNIKDRISYLFSSPKTFFTSSGQTK